MKKIIPYIVILGIGLFLGWLFFGNGEQGNNSASLKQENVQEHEEHSAVEVWTCSMHPQIRQPEPGDCPICGMELIPANSTHSKSDIQLNEHQIKMSDHALALANVQTTRIELKNTADEDSGNILKLSGQIEENESSLYTQTAHIGGRLEKFNVTYEGEYVKKGQRIGDIYSPELVAAQQELLIAYESKDVQPEIYQAVRQKLKLWKLSNAEINQIEQTKQVKNYFPLYADASGIVKQRIANVGNHVQTGAPLYMLTNLSTVWVVLEAYEKDLASLRVGQRVAVKTSAYPNEKFEGRISFIEPTLETKTRTVPVRVEIVNSNMKLKPGMLTIAEIEMPYNVTDSKRFTIPKSAVIWTGKRSVVYVKPYAEESVFELREVELGNTIGERVEVLSGLEIGEEIVTNGAFTIDSAAQLQGKTSMMNSSENVDSKKTVLEFKANEAFKNQLNVLYNAYIVYKDYLVEDKSAEALKQAEVIRNVLQDIEGNKLDPQAKEYWISLKGNLKTSLEKMIALTDIEKQRVHFKALSGYLLSAIEAFGIHEKVYVLHCPMADDDKGANWLSKENQVLNPYFGSKMLKCGEVKREITKQHAQKN